MQAAEFAIPDGEELALEHLPAWDSSYLYVEQVGADRHFRAPQQHERAIAWLGPLARIGATRALTEQQMRTKCHVVELRDPEISMLDVLSVAFTSLASETRSAMGRPTPIALRVLQRMAEPAVKFPVYVNYTDPATGRHFGMARVFRYMCVRQARGFGDVLLYYGVKKLTPDKSVSGEPYTPGYYAVPSNLVTRIKLAVESISASDNAVQLIDDAGNSYPPIDIDTFRRTRSPEYEVARALLVAQYPLSDWAELFATQPLQQIPEPVAGYKAFPAPPPGVTVGTPDAVTADVPAAAPATTEPAEAQIKGRMRHACR
jgi:hypothetical protein